MVSASSTVAGELQRVVLDRPDHRAGRRAHQRLRFGARRQQLLEALRRQPQREADLVGHDVRIAVQDRLFRNPCGARNAPQRFGAVRRRRRERRRRLQGRRRRVTGRRRLRNGRLRCGRTARLRRRGSRRLDGFGRRRRGRRQPVCAVGRERLGGRDEAGEIEEVGRRLLGAGDLIRASLVGRRGLADLAPDVIADRRGGCAVRKAVARRAGRSLHFDRDDVRADAEPVAVAQQVGRVETEVGAVDVGAVGRNIVKPVAPSGKRISQCLLETLRLGSGRSSRDGCRDPDRDRVPSPRPAAALRPATDPDSQSTSEASCPRPNRGVGRRRIISAFARPCKAQSAPPAPRPLRLTPRLAQERRIV